ncbi:Chitin synthase regulatory factor 3 [Wallemia ichthyophaga EXF-994]|nr:Chitin synthase regulatory factor 3 [Wallemia ichthyophaga EXF-994]EOR00353.1 Chitin synthase regulatory factor 3 [Wallemia ichthyophaga EXF-994]
MASELNQEIEYVPPPYYNEQNYAYEYDPNDINIGHLSVNENVQRAHSPALNGYTNPDAASMYSQSSDPRLSQGAFPASFNPMFVARPPEPESAADDGRSIRSFDTASVNNQLPVANAPMVPNFYAGAAPQMMPYSGYPPFYSNPDNVYTSPHPQMYSSIPPGYNIPPPPPMQTSQNRSKTSLSSLRTPTLPTRQPKTQVKNEMPYNRAFVDDYRTRVKGDPDPEAQFAYARYLITAAKKIYTDESPANPKSAHKYRDSLLAESIKVTKKLATQLKPGYVEAQFFLANCLGSGSLGLQTDQQKAYDLYITAAKRNHGPSTYRAAVCNELGVGTKKDVARSCELYRKAATLGETAAMYKIGVILLNGLLGVNRNAKDAIIWFNRAAQQADEENPHALHELALLYEHPVAGALVQDDNVAFDLFSQAAQYGYAPSQFKLGTAYEYGNLTCPVDPRRSIAWYTRAAEKGHSEAELALSGWYLTGSEGVLKQSDAEAFLWARRAANQGQAKAEYAVGYYSEVGIGVKQDLELAKKWYLRASQKGNQRASQRIAELKRLGNQRKNGNRPTRQQARDEGCIIT